jgi:hypothetical protein
MYIHIAEKDKRLAVISCSTKTGGMLFPEVIFGKIIDIIRSFGLL